MSYLIITLILLIAELIYFRLATWINITDNPNYRSSHAKPTIRGGGIIFPMAVLIYAIWDTPVSWWWIIGLMLVSIVSFLDDILTLPNRIRIVVHLLSASLLFYSLQLFNLWPIVLILLAYILVIGTINAWNFMDGINGMTALYCLSVLVLLLYLNPIYTFTDDSLIIIFGIATLIFGFFNVRKKAFCFAGDVGAVSIAFVLIFMVLSLIKTTHNPIFILAFAVYGVDSVMTICYRISIRENIFKAHRRHLYQLMVNEHQMPHILVAAIYFLLQMVVNILLISILGLSKTTQWSIGLVVLVMLSVAYWVIRFRLIRRSRVVV